METDLLRRFQEEKASRLKDGLYHETQIKLAYSSNRIEGSALSEKQTRFIFDTNTLSVGPNESVNVDDIIEAVNHFACFDYVLDMADEELSEDMIIDIHRILNTGTSDFRKEWFNASDYKARFNIVDGKDTTPPSEISDAMNALLNSYLEKRPANFSAIVDFHYHLEKIRPFQEDNGRVGRIIIFKECLKHGIVPFIIDDEYKVLYYQGLKEFEEAPGYLMETCISAQNKYKEMLRHFSAGE